MQPILLPTPLHSTPTQPPTPFGADHREGRGEQSSSCSGGISEARKGAGEEGWSSVKLPPPCPGRGPALPVLLPPPGKRLPSTGPESLGGTPLR